MKYRRLSLDELEELKDEFVRFLASNGVDSEDWVQLKTSKLEKAEKLIELFSDIVFDKVIAKVKYLEYRTKTELRLFECLDTNIKLIGVEVVGVNTIDFTQKQAAPEMFAQFRLAPAGSLKMYSAEKGYKENNRSQELFRMMESGSLISDGQLFRLLKDMK